MQSKKPSDAKTPKHPRGPSEVPGTPEYARRRALKYQGRETNEWGKNVVLTKEEALNAMWDRLPSMQMLRIPREVAERLDLDAAAKLVYGVLSNYPHGIILRRYAIAGVTGLTVFKASAAIHDLEKAGLLKCVRRMDFHNRFYFPSRYQVIPPPKRFKEHVEPRFIHTSLDNIEELIRKNFYEIES